MITRRVLVLAALMMLATGGIAAAEKPNAAFAGRIMLSDKRFPGQAKSLAAFNAQIRKQAKSSFGEDKDQKWKIYFAAFLKQPLNDLEYLVKIYELGRGGQQLLASFEQFTDERGRSSLLSYMNFDRKQMGANKELLMVVEAKGKTLATSKFRITGVQEKFSGKVNFSEDEAKKGTDE